MREVTSRHHYLVDFHPFVEQLAVQCLWTYCVVFYVFRALDLSQWHREWYVPKVNYV